MASLIDRLRAFVNPSSSLNAQLAITRGIATWQGQDGASFVRDGYAGNDIVYSIVTLITERAKVAPWAVYKVKNERKAKQYKALMASPDKIEDWSKVAQLKSEAYEIYEGDARLNELLTYPNEEDTWGDLLEAWFMFKLITGNAYIYGKMIEAGNNKDKPLTLYALPAQFMGIYANIETFPATKTGYQLYYGQLVQFDTREILHDKYQNPEWSITGNQLYGQSPLRAAAKTLTRSNEAKTAAVSAFQNGGPAGVLFMNDERFNPLDGAAQGQALKAAIAKNAGSKNTNKIEVSGYKVDYKQIGLSPVDLDIIESEKWDMRALCNIYKVPSRLLNDPENTTDANEKESQKALITRAVLPLLTAARDNFNRKLHKDWGYKGTGLIVDFSLDCYPELVADRAEQATYLNTAWWISPAQKMEIMGLKTPDFIPQQDMEKLYIPSNIAPNDEFGRIDLP